MAVAKRYFKEDVRAVGLTGDSTRSEASGVVTWTTTADGAAANVKWKDTTIEDQPHPALKAGSVIRYDKVNKTVEIEEAA